MEFEEAAGARVEAMAGDCDPYVAVCETLQENEFDEVIVSTLPERVSRWLRRDLPHRVRQLGVPVTVVTAPQAKRPLVGRRDRHRITKTGWLAFESRVTT